MASFSVVRPKECGVHHHLGWMLRVFAVLVAAGFSVAGAQAAVKCEGALAGPPLRGTLNSTQKFLQDISSAHRNGQGTISLSEFLIGVIDAKDTEPEGLNQHEPIRVKRLNEHSGKFTSTASSKLDITVDFGSSLVNIRLPKKIYGKYTPMDDGFQFVYDGPPIRFGHNIDSQHTDYEEYEKFIVMPSAIFFYKQSSTKPNFWDVCYSLSN